MRSRQEEGTEAGQEDPHDWEELLMYAAQHVCAEHPVVVISCSLEPRLHDHVGLGPSSNGVGRRNYCRMFYDFSTELYFTPRICIFAAWSLP